MPVSATWVGVTTDGGVTVQGYAYTDGTGNYEITVPANDPPHTNAYSVFIVPPAGFFPTNSTTIGSLWLQWKPDAHRQELRYVELHGHHVEREPRAVARVHGPRREGLER